MTYKKPTTAAEKEAAREASQQITAELMEQITGCVNVLAEKLAQGASEELLTFMRFSARFHAYSGNNQMLIWMQAPEARYVAGFQEWKRQGRSVKKGAKAVRVLAPVTAPDRDAQPGPDGRHPLKVVGFRYVSVFADHDTDGEPLPGDDFMTVQGGDEQTRDLLHGLSSAAHVPVEWVTAEDRSAHGWTDGGAIYLNRPRCEAQPAHAVRVLFHEWAHVVLHFQSAGKRAEDAPDRQTRELEADAAAYVLSSVHGIEAAAQVADYLTTWGGNPEKLRASLGRIGRAVSQIMKSLEQQAAQRQPMPQAAD
ncbi:N-terminal domain-containing protein [Deinococcus saxicola]|uniref:ArdC family protein n=1 Tax=Deinococcus saxicola TaxID=249406 RepID=UPI0039F12887